MSRTRKDSRQGTVVEVVKRPDGTFDVFLNHKLDREGIRENWLPQELCVRFGYCGEEYDQILLKLKQDGSATVSF